jgi:hypothetical protein
MDTVLFTNSAERVRILFETSHISDMMYSGDAAPSLADPQAVLSSTSDIHIPVTTLQARITLQRFLVLLYALLGNHHSLVQAFASFYDQFMQREPELVRAHPRVQEHRHIVPALLVLVLVPNPSEPKPNGGTTRLFGALQADRSERRMVPAISQSLHADPSFVHARGCSC